MPKGIFISKIVPRHISEVFNFSTDLELGPTGEGKAVCDILF